MDKTTFEVVELKYALKYYVEEYKMGILTAYNHIYNDYVELYTENENSK